MVIKTYGKKGIFLTLLTLIMAGTLIAAGCSGGGGGGTTGGTAASKATLSGTVTSSSGGSGGSLFKAKGSRLDKSMGAALQDSIPVSGADVLIYDLDSTSTTAVKETETGSDGTWSVELDPGNYVVFAVYFDRSTFALKVNRLDNVELSSDDIGNSVSVGSQVVESDETSPTIVSILDDITSIELEGKNTYEPSGIPIAGPIVITFSEAMSETTVKNAVSLKDSNGISVTLNTPTVNGTKTEFRFTPATVLNENAKYTLSVSVLAKDLVGNSLETAAKAVINTLSVSQLSESLKMIFSKPANNDSEVSTFSAITFSFNHPIDFMSLKGKLTITPAISGQFQPMGNTITLFPKVALNANIPYVMTIATGLKDMWGNELSEPISITFTTGDAALSSGNADEDAIAALVGKFQAALESKNFSAMLPLMTRDFTFEDMRFEDGQVSSEIMNSTELIENLKEEATRGWGFSDVKRISISNGTNNYLAEVYQNDTGYQILRAFIPVRFWFDQDGDGVVDANEGDIIGVEKEVVDPWCPDCPPRREFFHYIISGGSKDPNLSNPGVCETGTIIATVQEFNDQKMPESDPVTGQPVTRIVTVDVVDGDCDATNSWASDQEFGNNPWPQDGDSDTTNDPMPFNDSNLSNSDSVLSNDELWSSSESYYIADENGGWTDAESGTKYAEINGPQGWPYTYPNPENPNEMLIDYNADGDNDPSTTGNRHLEKVFVNFNGDLISSGADLQNMWQNLQGTMTPIPVRIRVLASNLSSVPQSEMFDMEPDWWLMNDDDDDCLSKNYQNCIDEDPVDGIDNDGDEKTDEDPQFSKFDSTDWGKLMDETTDAVVDHYYVISTDRLTIAPDSLMVNGNIAQGMIIDDTTETWSPHPPYDPNNPDRADLNGDGVVDDSDNNTVSFSKFFAAGFEKVGDFWLLARLKAMGENGQMDQYFVKNPIEPVYPAPTNTSGSFPQPPTGVGTIPVFEWSYPAAELEGSVQSVAVIVMEMSAPTSTSPPQPVAGRIIMLSGNPTSYSYGNGTGTDVTSDVLRNVEDLPFNAPMSGGNTTPLEEGKVYMWMVVAFGVAPEGIFTSDAEPIAESFPVLFATTTMPGSFSALGKANPISGALTKVRF